MSDSPDNQNTPTDSQETYYEKSENVSNSQLMCESQDFTLIDNEGTEDTVKDQKDVESIHPDSSDKKSLPSEDTEAQADDSHNNAMTCQNVEKTEKSSSPTSDDVEIDMGEDTKVESNTERMISEKNNIDEEDDVIQGTPPERYSSPSIKITTSAVAVKRKAGSFDEPASKISRMHSPRDVLELDEVISGTKMVGDIKTIDESSQCNPATKDEESEPGSPIRIKHHHDDQSETASISETKTRREHVIIEESENLNDSELVVIENSSNDSTEKTTILMQESSVTDISFNIGDEKCSKENLCDKEEESSEISKNDSTVVIELDKDTVPKSSEDTIVQVETNVCESENAVENTSTDTSLIIEVDVKKSQPSEIKKTIAENGEHCENVVEGNNERLQVTSDVNSNDPSCETEFNSTNKQRMSIEVVYDRKFSSQEKKQQAMELVEVNEESEEIVLDSSHEDYHLRLSTSPIKDSPKNVTIYKSCVDNGTSTDVSYKSLSASDELSKTNEKCDSSHEQKSNGDEETKKSDLTDKTVSCDSDISAEDITADQCVKAPTCKPFADSSDKEKYINVQLGDKPASHIRTNSIETVEPVNVISDSEGDNSLSTENPKSTSQIDINISSDSLAPIKTVAIKKKIRFYIDLSCLLHVDESKKTIMSKEIIDAHCEPIIEPYPQQNRNSDTSGFLADISGNENKDSSPGSVISNPQQFQLQGSRLSIMSTSSSASSAASLAARLMKETIHFSLPKGPAKHARKPITEVNLEDKQRSSEIFDKTNQEWKNSKLFTSVFFQSATAAVHSLDLTMDHDPPKVEDEILSSTPEQAPDKKLVAQDATPKSTKAKRAPKKARSKSSSTTQSSSTIKTSSAGISPAQDPKSPAKSKKRGSTENTTSEKLVKVAKNASTPSKSTKRPESLRSLSPQNEPDQEFAGKEVFAMWFDKSYYPGKIVDKIDEKFKVNFYDGKSKLLLEGFIILIPDVMPEGSLVCAITPEDEYGLRGIILKSDTVSGVNFYSIELEDGQIIRVETKDIFLMPDQAQALKELINKQMKRLPQTPQHLGEVSLDNLVDGKRKSRRANTPNVGTPKSRKETTPSVSKVINMDTPSVSGISKIKKKAKLTSNSESESKASDSSTSILQDVDGVQPEITSTRTEQMVKGPPSRMKGRGRSKTTLQKDDDELGPIPPPSSTIFKNMTFLLTCTFPNIYGRHTDDSNSEETGTENDEEWSKTPFVKDRLKKQLINGGGKVFDSFKQIPHTEYKNTKLITNVPNSTANSIQCLSVGITSYSHSWVIECCKKNKIVQIARYQLPAGWSKGKRMLIEMYDRPSLKPLNNMIIGMPKNDDENVPTEWIHFWCRICENIGAGVKFLDDPAYNFSHATAILADRKCPPWIIEKATKWQIPMVSRDWIMQCLIEGQPVDYDSHPSYKYTYIQS